MDRQQEAVGAVEVLDPPLARITVVGDDRPCIQPIPESWRLARESGQFGRPRSRRDDGMAREGRRNGDEAEQQGCKDVMELGCFHEC